MTSIFPHYQVSAIGTGGFTVNIKCRRIGNSSVLSIGSQADPLHLRVRGIK